MANATQVQYSKKIVADRDTIAERCHGTVEFDALPHASHLLESVGFQRLVQHESKQETEYQCHIATAIHFATIFVQTQEEGCGKTIASKSRAHRQV